MLHFGDEAEKKRKARIHARHARAIDRRRRFRRWRRYLLPIIPVLMVGAGAYVAIQMMPATGVDGARQVYFRNCREAHAAGYYNIPRGSPGYRVPLDADLDGLACEPLRTR